MNDDVSEEPQAPTGPDDAINDDVRAVYGDASETEGLARRDDFKPWHYPVKQVVRLWQWVDLTEKLIESRDDGDTRELHYFTLPGSDLLDVRALARTLAPRGVRINYFGFDSGWEEGTGASGEWTTAESVLRQGGLITDDAVIHQDRLEDLALPKSHAATQLRQQSPFDVVNIDACSHLAHSIEGRPSLFDALGVLLQHQLGAKGPWLLFITTRADPDIGGPTRKALEGAILENLKLPGTTFRDALAQCIRCDPAAFPENLEVVWGDLTEAFLKLYTVGLGKFLLQFFHAQPNVRARVELASSYAYRVANDNPDMLALAFRVTPVATGVVALPPNIGGPINHPLLEQALAARIAHRASKLWDLDQGIEADEDAHKVAYEGSAELLKDAGYDTVKWRAWADGHLRQHLTQ